MKHFSEFALNVGRDDLLDLMLENGARVNVKKEEDQLIFLALFPIGKLDFLRFACGGQS